MIGRQQSFLFKLFLLFAQCLSAHTAESLLNSFAPPLSISLQTHTPVNPPQGFSGQLFPLYYDSKTWNPYKKADQVAIEFDGMNRSAPSSIYIAFPAMRKLAQDHFGCPTLPGTPADVGSFASHFKQRVMGVSGASSGAVACK